MFILRNKNSWRCECGKHNNITNERCWKCGTKIDEPRKIVVVKSKQKKRAELDAEFLTDDGKKGRSANETESKYTG